jgi:hypothetical protein
MAIEKNKRLSKKGKGGKKEESRRLRKEAMVQAEDAKDSDGN